MEKQSRTSKYRNLRTQLKKESSYLEQSETLQDAYTKGVIKSNEPQKIMEPPSVSDANTIEQMIKEIKNDIVNNPGKTQEEIDRSLKMFEERVELAKRNTKNVDSIVQQINAWQKSNAPRPTPRRNTITNSTRSTTMLNAVNVDLTVDDLIKARQEVVEKLKNNPSKASLRFDETITARVLATTPIKPKRKNQFFTKLNHFFVALFSTILIVLLILAVILVILYFKSPDTVDPIFEYLKRMFGF